MAEFDASGETLAKTTLGKLKTGSLVNVERAMSASDRFGGHFVQGHIDATGKIKKIENKGGFWQFVFETPKDVLDYIPVFFDAEVVGRHETTDTSFRVG